MKMPFAALLIVFASVSVVCAGDWPQWRGPQRNGQFTGPVWPDKLDASHLHQVWRVELGPSYSGPIVSGKRVFTTETKDKKFEAVTAFDRKTGKELWRTQWEGAVSVPFFARSNGDWIRATPACDGESLFVAGMRDVLVCLDVETGKERWRLSRCDQSRTAGKQSRTRCAAKQDNAFAAHPERSEGCAANACASLCGRLSLEKPTSS